MAWQACGSRGLATRRGLPRPRRHGRTAAQAAPPLAPCFVPRGDPLYGCPSSSPRYRSLRVPRLCSAHMSSRQSAALATLADQAHPTQLRCRSTLQRRGHFLFRAHFAVAPQAPMGTIVASIRRGQAPACARRVGEDRHQRRHLRLHSPCTQDLRMLMRLAGIAAFLRCKPNVVMIARGLFEHAVHHLGCDACWSRLGISRVVADTWPWSRPPARPHTSLGVRHALHGKRWPCWAVRRPRVSPGSRLELPHLGSSTTIRIRARLDA